jgi:hypothetical protein
MGTIKWKWPDDQGREHKFVVLKFWWCHVQDRNVVPTDDTVLMNVDCGGDLQHLRHFVAVDHVNKKVVLSIQGTFSLSEIVVDVTGFSREHKEESLLLMGPIFISVHHSLSLPPQKKQPMTSQQGSVGTLI